VFRTWELNWVRCVGDVSDLRICQGVALWISEDVELLDTSQRVGAIAPELDRIVDSVGAQAISAFEIDPSRLHWDMTSVSLYGTYDQTEDDYPHRTSDTPMTVGWASAARTSARSAATPRWWPHCRPPADSRQIREKPLKATIRADGQRQRISSAILPPWGAPMGARSSSPCQLA
jgi:hypothetical protein